MHKLTTLNDITLLRESLVLECKAAQGIYGQGEVPKDFWPTYSAMSNAHGGLVILGIQEKSGVFSVLGLKDINKVRSDLFNILNWIAVLSETIPEYPPKASISRTI